MVKIPKKITPCPIANATVEFRFATEWDVERLRDEVHSRIKDQYPSFEELPILQLPSEILQQDELLRYQPYYQFVAASSILRLGARVISVTTQAQYSGWNTFQSKCLEIWDIVNQLGAIQEIERLGLRYVNVFEDSDIFPKTRISPNVQIEFDDFKQKTSYFRSFFQRGVFGCLLQVSNELTNTIDQRNASMIDIDVSLEKAHLQHDTLPNSLDSAHTIEKELFFGLLQSEFLNTLNPEY